MARKRKAQADPKLGDARKHVKTETGLASSATPSTTPGVFPLLALPYEIRAQIYSEVLCDPDGVNIKTRNDVERKKANSSSAPADAGAATALLLTCRAVHDEVAPILYGQPMLFDNLGALTSFLKQVGPHGVALLKDVTLRQWDGARFVADNRTVHECMGMLAAAKGLRRLNFRCKVGGFGGEVFYASDDDDDDEYYYSDDGEAPAGSKKRRLDGARSTARIIVQTCSPFLLAWAGAEQDHTELRNPSKMVEIHPGNLDLRWLPGETTRTEEGEMEKFRAELWLQLRKLF
jgi:hypothetical protein